MEDYEGNRKQCKTPILNCPRCELVNAIDNKYCSKCKDPLKPEAYDEIKGMGRKKN